MNRARALLFCIVAALTGSEAFADWTATGTFQYRDREWDSTGFTGVETPLPIRLADVEIRDNGSGAVLATGVTDENGSFSIFVSDSSTRDVYARVITDSSETADLHLEVTDGTNPKTHYAVAGNVVAGHPPGQDLDFGAFVAEIGQGGEPFNLYDNGLRGIDFLAFLQGGRPAQQQSLNIRWAPNRGQGVSFAGSAIIEMRDTAGYDDTVLLHEIAHYAVLNYSDSDSPGGTHGPSLCDEDPRLAWDEGHASYWGCAARKHFSLANPHVYISTTGGPGAGQLNLYFDLETESQFECSGATSEAAVYTALWDMFDGPATQDDTPGVDDGPVDTLDLSDVEHWETMTDGLPGRSFIAAEDYWDAWFETPVLNGFLAELISIWGDGVEIEYFEDAQEPNGTDGTAAPIATDGSLVHNTFFNDPEGDGSGGRVRDTDWFSFSAATDVTYRIETLNLWSGADTTMTLFDDQLNTLASNDNRAAGDPSSLIEWTATATATLFIRITQPLDGTLYGSYDVTVYPTNDADGDGVADVLDNCPIDPNAGQEDADADGLGDVCDNCPTDPNAGQEDADADGLGDACDACPNDPDDDLDADGVCGDVDNCPTDPNAGQEDADADGLGDACDACPNDPDDDLDADGVCGDVDNCPTDPNAGQEDADADGLGDACDACPNDPDNDLDADGVCGDVDN